MKDLIKKVLTDKKSRDSKILGLFIVSAMTAMVPWQG